eukprot:scaffold7198_cov122-Isochrysis_galbana.AAC.1
MATPARNSAWCHRCARATTRSCGKAVKRPLATYGQGWTGWGWGGGGVVGGWGGGVAMCGGWGVVLVGADLVVLLLEGLGSEFWVKRLWIWGYRQVYARGICPRRNHPIEGVRSSPDGGGPNCGRYSAGAILRYRALFSRTGHGGVLPTPCHGVTSPDCRPAGVNGHTSCQGVTSPGLCGGGRLKPRPSRSRISSRVRGLRRS